MTKPFCLLALVLFTAGSLRADPPPPATPAAPGAPAKPKGPPQPPPSVADVAYGLDPMQKMDIYLPPGTGPFPVNLWIHGGGWKNGDKKDAGGPAQFLAAGCAVVSVNYRLIKDAVAEKVTPPIVAVLGDNRRALQYIRLHAADWHLDPDKIVVSGGSAGAASALYLGCEGERADPSSSDPVERVSTKILGVGAAAAQSSIDPKQIAVWVPGCAWGYWAFEPDLPDRGKMDDFNKVLAERDKWLPYIQKYSPDLLLTKDAPPIFFSYGQRLPEPGTTPPTRELVHCPLWGVGFQKLAQSLGVTCYLQYPGHPAELYNNMTKFLLHQLGLDPKK